ncbi:MAG: binding-protein-dependent transport system inner rane component [Myxococcaceae bacterium]|nr:binding-protein-dependent transport system inner rane component [Myxococcaceae bacterium]
MTRQPLRERLSSLLEGAVVPLVVLAAWELSARLGLGSAVVLPAPSAVLSKWLESLLPAQPFEGQGSVIAWALSGELVQDAASSLVRVLAGFAIALVLALPLGLAMGALPRLYRLTNPLLQLLRPIPPLAYVPMAILWFGLGNPPAIFLIALGAFFPILMSTISGVRQVDALYLRAAQSLGAGRVPMFTRVILPAATPHIFSGVRIGVGTAFIVVIVSEMIAVNDGLGFRILEAREFMWSDKVVAGMATIGLLGLLLDTLIARLNAHLLRWHRGMEG